MRNEIAERNIYEKEPMYFLGGGNLIFPLFPSNEMEKRHYYLSGMIK